MKKHAVLPALLLITAAIGLMGYKNTTNKAAANARQLQGLYIFTDCTPAGDYEIIGTVKGLSGFSFKSAQYESIRDKFIQRAKEQYPAGEGLILDLRDGGADKADVIKFK